MRNIGAWLKSAFAFPTTAALAAGTGDDTEVNGSSIDRFSLGQQVLSGKLLVNWLTTLDTGETLSIAANFQDSPTGTDQWADYGDVVASTVVVTAGSDTEFEGVFEMDISLGGAKQHVRVQVTPDLSRAGTDTAEISGVVVFGGADELPFGSTV
jgi:hypothetical protein